MLFEISFAEPDLGTTTVLKIILTGPTGGGVTLTMVGLLD